MSIMNVLLGSVLLIFIVIAVLFCLALAAVLVISIWALVKPWISPVVDAWFDWIYRRTS